MVNIFRRIFGNQRHGRIGAQPYEIDELIRHPNIYSSVQRYLIVVGSIICLCSFILYASFCFDNSLDHIDGKSHPVFPRQTRILTDWGHSQRFHGWVDVQQQGVPNDYARYVGPNAEYPFVWLAIALAGSTEQYTDPGLYEEHCGIVKRTLVKPRQKLPGIDELGLKSHFKGWVDVQNQGVPNDYAYYVEPTYDNPFPWLTLALAGSTEQRTCIGMYEEKYGVVRRTQNKQFHGKIIAAISDNSTMVFGRSNDARSQRNSPLLSRLFKHSNDHVEPTFVSNVIHTSLKKSHTVPSSCNFNSANSTLTIISQKSSTYMACTTYIYICRSNNTDSSNYIVTLAGAATLERCGTNSITNIDSSITCTGTWTCCYTDNCNKCPYAGCIGLSKWLDASFTLSSNAAAEFPFYIFFLILFLVSTQFTTV